MPRRLTWLDVFTATPLTGNQLAVVHDADDVSDDTMLAFARETKLSETTFVQRASAPGADYRNRIFTTVSELDFAGHPSLGTAVAVALADDVAQAAYVQETRAGRQPVHVERAASVWRASMTQEVATFGDELDAAEVLAATGLDAAAAHPELPPQVVSTGLPQVIAPVRDAAALRDVRPDFDRLGALLRRTGATVVYLAAVDGASARARSFLCDVAFPVEDPATGSAAGPLCAYLYARGVTSEVAVDQGVEMGRPSRIACAMEDGGRVSVAGDCVVVATGAVDL